MSRDSGNFEGVFRKLKNKANRPKKKEPKLYLGDTELGRASANGFSDRGLPKPDDIFAAGTGKGGTYGVRIHKAKSGAVKGRGKLGGVR